MGFRIFRFAAILLILASPAVSQETGTVWSPAPGRYASVRLSVNLPPGASGEYRFVENGDGIWRPLSGSLDLTAFPREERTYRILLRVQNGSERAESEARYVIDRVPPLEPGIQPPPGSYEGPTALRLSAEAGAVIFYSLEARDRPSPGFRIYDPADPPRVDRPKDGTRSWTLSAYAVDSAGTPGPAMTARYSVEPNPSGAYDPGAAVSGNPDMAEGAALEYSLSRPAPGIIRITFPAEEGRKVYAAVNPPDPRKSQYYAELPAVSGKAILELAAPTGWTGPLSVRCAALEGKVLRLSPDPIEAVFSYEDPTEPPPAPPEPRVVSPPGTRTALLSWEPFPFRIEVSVEGGGFSPYTSPISVLLPEGDVGLSFRYRSVAPGGAFSETRTLTLNAQERTGLPEISGLPKNGVTNKPVRPASPPGTFIRYEVSQGDSLPKPVTAESPLLTGDTVFPGEEGKETPYTLRLRAFTDSSPEASGSDERFVKFMVDRLPPPPPKLSPGSLDGGDEDDRVVAFEPGEGTIRFAVTEKGAAGEPEYKPYKSPVVLEGSGERPVAYEVRAYASDPAGNESAHMGPITVRIDRASVYVASWGSDSSGGGPRNPLATLAAGAAAAVRSGKRIVRVQGDVPLGGALRPDSAVEILGGCDESWEAVPGGKSRIDASRVDFPLFLVYGTSLALKNLSIAAEGPRDLVLAEVREGELETSGLELNLAAPGELTVVQAVDSRVTLEDSTAVLSNALFARVVDAQGGKTRIRGLRLRAEKAVGYLTAFSFREGEAVISGARSESFTSGGFTFVRGTRTRTDIRESYIKARGTGFCEAFRFEGGQAAVYLTSADLGCDGPLSFAFLEDARGDILHATVHLFSGRAVLLSLKNSGIRLGNSILSDATGEAVLLRTDRPVERGTIVRNALSGFREYLEGPVPAATVHAFNQIAAPPDGLNFTETFGKSVLKDYAGLPSLPASSPGRGGAYPVPIPASPDGRRAETVRGDVGAFEAVP